MFPFPLPFEAVMGGVTRFAHNIKIFDSIIPLVLIAMMNIKPGWQRAIMQLPNNPMQIWPSVACGPIVTVRLENKSQTLKGDEGKLLFWPKRLAGPLEPLEYALPSNTERNRDLFTSKPVAIQAKHRLRLF